MYNKEINIESLKLEKGYLYFIDYTHPLKMGNSAKVYLHRHIASIKLGRWLTTDEHVHHKDENKLNNDPNNLEILSISEHAKRHKQKYLPSIMCTKCKKLFIQKSNEQIFCSNECRISSQIKLDGLSTKQLEYLIWTESYTSLAKQFNCSDNGIKKWAIRIGCRLPPSRFHVKFVTKEKKLEQYNRQVVERNTRES